MSGLNGFYCSDAWRKLREQIILERSVDGIPRCEECGGYILSPKEVICHHVIELDDENVSDTDISLNPNNIKVVCHKCHNKIHERWQGGQKAKEVYIVYGPPCSGKSTWVEKHAGRNDIIIDIDRIYQMITINPMHDKPDSIKNVAFKIRDYLYDICYRRFGRWEKCFVVGGFPYIGDRERLRARLGAELVYMDVCIDECLYRRRFSGRPSCWDDFIREWFDKYEAG